MFTCAICNSKSDLHAYPYKGRMVCQKCYYAKRDGFSIEKLFKKVIEIIKSGIIIRREYYTTTRSITKENTKTMQMY